MRELITTQAPAELQKYLMLLNSPQIMNVPLKELKLMCKKWIGECYLKTGYHSPGEKALTLMVDTFALDLKNFFSKLTTDEITEALRRGAYKEYGDFLTIANTTLFGWAKAFKATPERGKAVSYMITPKEKDMSADERKSISEEAIKECEFFYKKTGQILDYGNANYNYLWKIGKLRFTEAVWADYILQAKKEMLIELEERRLNIVSVSEKRDIEKELAKLDSSDGLKIEARKIALKKYFDKFTNSKPEKL